MTLAEFFTKTTGICETKSEARRMVKQGAMYINKKRIPRNAEHIFVLEDVILLFDKDKNQVFLEK